MATLDAYVVVLDAKTGNGGWDGVRIHLIRDSGLTFLTCLMPLIVDDKDVNPASFKVVAVGG
jgi:hypothetical protein